MQRFIPWYMISRESTVVLDHWVSQLSENTYSITQTVKGGRCVCDQRHDTEFDNALDMSASCSPFQATGTDDKQRNSKDIPSRQSKRVYTWIYIYSHWLVYILDKETHGKEYARTAYYQKIRNFSKNGIYMDETYILYAACKVEYQRCNQSNSKLTYFVINCIEYIPGTIL